MPWHPSLDHLCDALADLYPDGSQARRIARAAHLLIDHTIARDQAGDIWDTVLQDAVRQQRVGAVISAALREHPGDRALRVAAGAYARWVAMGRPPVSPTGAQASADSPQLELGGDAALELVRVPAGEFLMGRPASDTPSQDDAGPQHKVWLPAYLIGRYPVTVAQYHTFTRATGEPYPPAPNDARPPPDHPVTNVTWWEALAFCRWAANVTRWTVRLPSEAEWEKAACWDNGAQRARVYPWGDRWRRWCNFDGSHRGSTTPVAHYSPRGDSAYGCADMAGNAWEWTSSLWGANQRECAYPYPYDPRDGRENAGAGDEMLRIIRGGSFRDSMENVRCAVRHRGYPDIRQAGCGFRVAVSPDP